MKSASRPFFNPMNFSHKFCLNKILVLVSLLFAPFVYAEERANKDLGSFLKTKGYSAIDLKKIDTGHETLTVTINGKTGTFILDSGAGATILHADNIAKFDIDESKQQGSESGVGAGGDIDIGVYPIDSFKLNGVEFVLPEINVTDLEYVVDAVAEVTGDIIDGVVGQDILTAHEGIIDVANSKLYLKQ